MAENLTDIGVEEIFDPELDYHALNAQLNLCDENGRIQFEADRKAACQYFLQHVNQNMVLFHDLEEKLDYFVREGYYEVEVLVQYDLADIKALFKRAYAHKFRFPVSLGASKYYTSHTFKTFDGKRYLERFEDRISTAALYLARGDLDLAQNLVDEIMTGRLQPATPTFLDVGKKAQDELVSCFLLRVEDSMESIARGTNPALRLSKRGGGVALSLTNLREAGAPIKKIQNQSSGVVSVIKLLEDSFPYANQLGVHQGAGAVYLRAHHPDILSFLDTKRESADKKVYIKILSLGVVIPGITFQLAKNNEDIYFSSPYDVEGVYEVLFSEISATEKYHEIVDDGRIHKKKINAHCFSRTLAEIQSGSGCPYIIFEDTVNEANPIKGRITMLNLRPEVLQVSETPTYSDDLFFSHVGKDISCNLGPLNIAKAMDSPDFSKTIETAIRGLIAVSDLLNIQLALSAAQGNTMNHAISLGAMSLHSYLVREYVTCGSEEAFDFANMYFLSVAYEAIKASCLAAKEHGETSEDLADSKYAPGEYFKRYINGDQTPKAKTCKALPAKSTIHVSTPEDWRALAADVKRYDMYNQSLQMIPPTGLISYINNSTSSIHPIVSKIEIRKEDKIGRVYYPASFMTNENLDYYADAHKVGPEKTIDTYMAAMQYVDQGLSLALSYPDMVTTRDINKSYIYAWRKGIKTLYYMRLRQTALRDIEVQDCVSCMLRPPPFLRRYATLTIGERRKRLVRDASPGSVLIH